MNNIVSAEQNLSSSTFPKNILIVDDVLENIRLLSSILEKQGYQTRKAISGKMALMAVKTDQPSLILLDIRMPEMTGYEVCQQLKSNPKTNKIPIIFLSAADEVSDKLQGFQAGGADYITKPFHIEEVLARVQHQLTIIKAHKTISDLNTRLEERVKERTQELEIANNQLLTMAFQDSLTKLPNRALLMKELWQSIEKQIANPHDQFAVLYLDCDRFKIINDSLGHLAGDELLIAVAQRLKSILNTQDLLARLGGDEFVILLTQITEQSQVKEIVENIFQRFTDSFTLREREVFLSFSIGVVTECSHYRDPEALLRHADIAMYKAKSLGKNQYQIFAQAMYEEACQRLQMETELRKGMQFSGFTLHYQPIIELNTGKIVGTEALIRWYHPTLGLIPPAEFIPIAEETGLIIQMGEWILKQACSQLRSWQEQKIVDPYFYISVNVSAYQFSRPQFVQQIDDILAETQISPQCLRLEITETAIMDNTSSAAMVIDNIRQRNIQLSIDDFGTGYSSLSYLHSFPVDNLKIDRSFIERLQDTPASLSMVQAMIQIAKNMGMNIIAEGIETNEQWEQLKLLNCPFGQGFLFSQPLDAEKIADVIMNGFQKK
ncbi:EAL domain-containing protein [Okeanomitos corallinicola TIOX110]|uniref:EAL domain-containing protein n=1 Tax=Okeanomitos corallinicola TIOX110 TaxID=3133117 RepID=A0ABZ2UXS2_9CYAN